MYIPKHFAITDTDEIFSFVEANAFGQLISQVDGQLFASHLPFLVAPDRSRLIGHLARQNPQHLQLDGQQVLVILPGPHEYISPAWYAGTGVPTWNYQAVHIHGHGATFHEPDRLRTVVDALTAKYESRFETPWQPDYNAAMLNAIVGIEVTITDVQCKYKLSQNRTAQDRAQVVEMLKLAGANALADAMERNESDSR